MRLGEYHTDVRTFRFLLSRYGMRWNTPSRPPHRRPSAGPLTEEELETFDEYIAFRDENMRIIAQIMPYDERSKTRRNLQAISLLIEQIGVDLGYPGLEKRHSVDTDPEHWVGILETVQGVWDCQAMRVKGGVWFLKPPMYELNPDERYIQFMKTFPASLKAMWLKVTQRHTESDEMQRFTAKPHLPMICMIGPDPIRNGTV